MTKAELIAILEEYPDDTKICIQDWGLGTLDAGETFDSFNIREGKRVPYFVIRSKDVPTLPTDY
jgi:hypothetical protein